MPPHSPEELFPLRKNYDVTNRNLFTQQSPQYEKETKRTQNNMLETTLKSTIANCEKDG